MKLPFAITRKSILILVIVCLCGVVHYETIPPHELYPDTLNMIEAGGLNDSTIVYRIVEQELAFHKSKRLLVEGKIFDYKNIFVIPEENPEDPVPRHLFRPNAGRLLEIGQRRTVGRRLDFKQIHLCPAGKRHYEIPPRQSRPKAIEKTCPRICGSRFLLCCRIETHPIRPL